MSDLNKLWISDASGKLGTIDLSTNTVTVIGNTGVVLFDIAWSPSGELWGVDNYRVYKINSTTAQITVVGSLGAFANALTFNQDGTLYAAGGSGIYTVNTTTGTATQIGTLPVVSGGDLAFLNTDLYLSTSNSELYKINLANPANSQKVGGFGILNVYGIAATSINGVIYGAGAGRQIVQVDVNTGHATPFLTYEGGLGDAYGMAFRQEAIVDPEPYYPPIQPLIQPPKPTLKGQFEVPSNSLEGTSFTNPSNEEVTIEFIASGVWYFKPGSPTTAAGITAPEEGLLGVLQYPNLTPYSLVVVDQTNNTVEEVGLRKTIRLKPAQTLTFKNNDETEWYWDNTGSITVNWSVI